MIKLKWQDIHAEASSEKGVTCYLQRAFNPIAFSKQKEDRVFKPDFLLVRNFPADLHDKHYRNVLMAFVFCDIPSVNSVESIIATTDRAISYANLLKIKKRLGADKLPLVPMKFHPNSYLGTKKMLIENKYPAVIKVGSTHAGFGKALVKTEQEYYDTEGLLALHHDYYTIEPFVKDIVYEYRVQKIGDHYRAYKRYSTTNWKGNWGDIKFEDQPWTPKCQLWADEVGKMFGGLDIFALDVLVTKQGTEHIIEVNDTACGLMYDHEAEDVKHIKELVLGKMKALFVTKGAK